MNRFFKSAAFPILIVVVLAFFAQKLISPSPAGGPVHSYKSLVTQDIPNGQVRSADVKTKDNVVDVTLVNNQKYEVGFVPGQAAADLIKPADGGAQPSAVQRRGHQEQRLAVAADLRRCPS